MAHFYGSVQGAKGEAGHRLGTANSGLTTICASWDGAVYCRAYVDDNGTDCVRITFERWHGRGSTGVIYDGPISGAPVVQPA